MNELEVVECRGNRKKRKERRFRLKYDVSF